ncbi:GNAT family N-acetyltransferase [Arthrobacter cryoconiti]|uniref:GNAT family N-acetyltransferase n=1 Tax=Arthrobacter cryoconiti TaxID=748907 RepID=A0ABV8QUT8_9MICC|nr:GNAT family protein [Arthrobacter cryoconiti]MCC9069724.1 GNAT family N-acetyltransferase [Arthrobacter cryoconiti]
MSEFLIGSASSTQHLSVPEADGCALSSTVSIRLLTTADALAVATASARNKAFLQPWEPIRPDSFYTLAGQEVLLADSVALQHERRSLFWILFHDGAAVGRISLTDIVRGAFSNGHLGYWVAEDHQGQGLATAAVRFVCNYALEELGLHRLQAGTLIHNVGSQKVLTRCGFTSIGIAEKYIRINGWWQDHQLFQRILSPED